jgi:hypothetical protein
LRFEALNRLWQSVNSSSHDFRASTEVFPNLDLERVASDLELVRRAKERGAANQPPANSVPLDEVELRVVERVEEEKKKSHQILEDQIQTFGERLTNLDFDGQFLMIKQAGVTTVTDYTAEWQSGIDTLHGLRRSLNDAERERTAFRFQHRLDRAARLATPSQKLLKILFLIFCVIAEMLFNGSFLARGSDQGFVGGATLAAGFAALNIGSAVFAAYLVKFARHKNLFGKLLGAASMPLYLGFAGLLNLALAHYRETSEKLFGEAGREVIRRISEAPFQLSDIQSWVLFGVGIFFSIAAFLDSWTLTDPYPGYSGTELRLQKIRSEYVETRQDLIESLRGVRDEYSAKIEDVIRDLSARKREYDAIISHRARITQLFNEHQNHLERTANTLLATYREENRKSRSTAAPKYFSGSFKLERILPPLKVIGEFNEGELANSIRLARDELSDQAKRIADEFGNAVERYRNLDDLHPDQVNGQAQA